MSHVESLHPLSRLFPMNICQFGCAPNLSTPPFLLISKPNFAQQLVVQTRRSHICQTCSSSNTSVRLAPPATHLSDLLLQQHIFQPGYPRNTPVSLEIPGTHLSAWLPQQHICQHGNHSNTSVSLATTATDLTGPQTYRHICWYFTLLHSTYLSLDTPNPQLSLSLSLSLPTPIPYLSPDTSNPTSVSPDPVMCPLLALHTCVFQALHPTSARLASCLCHNTCQARHPCLYIDITTEPENLDSTYPRERRDATSG